MAQFKVIDKATSKRVNVDKIDPSKHLHFSSFTESRDNEGQWFTRGAVEFSAATMRQIQEQYGSSAVCFDEDEVAEPKEHHLTKAKRLKEEAAQAE